MNDFPQITLTADVSLVTVKYAGRVTAAELRAHAAEVDAIATKVKPGFVVMSDLTHLDSMDPDCAPLISRIMEQFNRFGAGRLIRVIPDPKKDIGLGILTLFHYRRGIPVNTVSTLAEAKRLL